jgi:hypothetical protein
MEKESPRQIWADCDARHRLTVRRITAAAADAALHAPHDQSNWGSGMLLRTFVHLTTETIVVAIALMLALPFFLALSSPFTGW